MELVCANSRQVGAGRTHQTPGWTCICRLRAVACLAIFRAVRLGMARQAILVRVSLSGVVYSMARLAFTQVIIRHLSDRFAVEIILTWELELVRMGVRLVALETADT